MPNLGDLPKLQWERRQWTGARWTQVLAACVSPDDWDHFVMVLADHIVANRFRMNPHLPEAWRQVVSGGRPYSELEKAAIAASLGVVRPAQPAAQVEAFVAEYLWHYIVTHDESEAPIAKVVGPKFYPTAPGGDGLVVRRGPELRYTLWEIKKDDGDDLSGAVTEAYDQLKSHATRYLAEFSEVEQTDEDPGLARLFARLVESWLGGESSARAGVAVASSTVPKKCFTTMGKHFPQLVSEDSRHGITASVTAFPVFADRVRTLLWTGL